MHITHKGPVLATTSTSTEETTRRKSSIHVQDSLCRRKGVARLEILRAGHRLESSMVSLFEAVHGALECLLVEEPVWGFYCW